MTNVYLARISMVLFTATRRRRHWTFTEDILRGMDKSQISSLVLIYLSRRFGAMGHETLITQIEMLMFPPGKFSSYLSGNTQKARVGDSLSEALHFEIGTFQEQS